MLTRMNVIANALAILLHMEEPLTLADLIQTIRLLTSAAVDRKLFAACQRSSRAAEDVGFATLKHAQIAESSRFRILHILDPRLSSGREISVSDRG